MRDLIWFGLFKTDQSLAWIITPGLTLNLGEPPTDVDSEDVSENKVESVETSENVGTIEAEEVQETLKNVTVAPVEPEPEPNNVTESIESIVLPEVGSAAKEHSSSLAIFFLLFVIILSIFLIHLLLKVKFHYLPESLAMGK